MATVTLTMTFYGATNNSTDIIMEGYSQCPYYHYDTHKHVNEVVKIFPDLKGGCSYMLDISGYTAGTVKISLTGDLTNPKDETYGPGNFGPTYLVNTL